MCEYKYHAICISDKGKRQKNEDNFIFDEQHIVDCIETDKVNFWLEGKFKKKFVFSP